MAGASDDERERALALRDVLDLAERIDRAKDWVDIAAILDEQPVDAAYVRRWLLHLQDQTAWPRIRRFVQLHEEAARA